MAASATVPKVSALSDLLLQCSNVCNLPRFSHLAIGKVRDHGLIDAKAAPAWR